MQAKSNDVDVLNRLTKHVIDSANGYEEAAKLVKDSQLEQEFRTLCNERQAIARELQTRVAALGGKPESSGSAQAAGHRVWMDIKAAFSSDAKQAVIEVERGEDYLRDQFRDAMSALSPQGQASIQDIMRRVQMDHDRWSALKHRMTGDASGGHTTT